MELTQYTDYEEFKAELDTELQRSAEAFVKIGYLLRLARDTGILCQSGYSDVNEFAKAEYGIDKTMVSKWIHINERFSENGYSPRLKEGYRGMGYAKLAIMLQLPDSINEEITPEYTKSEIQVIKDELDGEKKVTDIEVALEARDEYQKYESIPVQALKQLLHDKPELFKELYMAAETGEGEWMAPQQAALLDIVAPNGAVIYLTRVAGIGKLSISIKTEGDSFTVANLRTDEKWEHTLSELKSSVVRIMQKRNRSGKPEAAWEAVYKEAWPAEEKKKEVAPVQQKKETRKQSRVVVAKKPEKRQEEKLKSLAPAPCGGDTDKRSEQMAEDMPEAADAERTEGTEKQIPGQMEVADYPELMPGAQSTHDASEVQMMSDTELSELWDMIAEAGDKVGDFISDTEACEIISREVPTETVEKAYNAAVSLAAGLEKLMMEMKRREESNE